MTAGPRLCMVLPSLGVGGTERQVIYLLEGLADTFSLDVICTREGGRWMERAQAVADVTALGLRSGWDPRLLGRLRRSFRGRRSDVVQSFMFGFDYWVDLAARREGVPVVVSSRRQRAAWKKRRHIWLQRRANRLTDAIVANCRAVAQFAAAQEKISADAYTIVYNGVDVAADVGESRRRERVELTIPHGAPVVGMVANYSPDKDHALFVEMAARIHAQRPEAHFVLAGDGPGRPAIQRMVIDRGLGDAFRFVTGRDDIGDLYSATDVVVLCSATEGFPNAVLEAMAHGRPVVASAVGGIPELIEDGVTGRLIGERAPERFSDAVLELIDDRDMAVRLGERARAHVSEHFDVPRMVASYRDLYLRLLAEKRTGAGA